MGRCAGGVRMPRSAIIGGGRERQGEGEKTRSEKRRDGSGVSYLPPPGVRGSISGGEEMCMYN